MGNWVAEHQSELTLVGTFLLACFMFAIWASRKGMLRRSILEGGAARPPAGLPPTKEEFHGDCVRCGESDIPIDDVVDRHRKPGDGGRGGQTR